MIQYQCEFCSKSFASKSGMKIHQTRTKYCIKIQQKMNLNVVDKLETCQYCCTKYEPKTIKRHLVTCKLKQQHDINAYEVSLQSQAAIYEERIKVLENKLKSYLTFYEEQLREQAKDYEEQLQEHSEQISQLRDELIFSKGQMKVMEGDHKCLLKIASQSKVTNVTNNTKILSMNPLDLSQERLHNIISTDLTYNHSLEGQKGIAEFVDQKVLIDECGKSNYGCTDKSRRVFKHKDKDGNVCTDIEAKQLTDGIFKAGIAERSQQVSLDWCMNPDGTMDEAKRKFALDKINEVRKMKRDNSVFTKELSIRKAT